MGYDYTGYGSSSGEPTMGGTFADISAVYTCLVEHYKVPPMSIILYGQSVGSGPSVRMCERWCVRVCVSDSVPSWIVVCACGCWQGVFWFACVCSRVCVCVLTAWHTYMGMRTWYA